MKFLMNPKVASSSLAPQPKNKIKSYSHNDCRIYFLLKNALKSKIISQISVKHIKKTEKMEKTERYEEGFFAFLP